MEISKELISAALDVMSRNYQKMLRVNLTTDFCEAGVVPDDEEFLKENKTCKISEYWSWFLSSSLLHHDDVVCFRRCIKRADAGMHVVYRRLFDGEWHRVLMELIPTVNYSHDNKECILFVRDIDCIYSGEYDAVVEKIGTTDPMTGLLNKLAFERDIKNLKDDIVGVVYADINGLKFTNDNFGHDAGDELILKFANLLALRFNDCKCYHISGDEFVALSTGCPIREFLNKAIKLHKGLWNTQEFPIASIGYAVGERVEIRQIIKDADNAMLDDKRIFNAKFPKYKRV